LLKGEKGYKAITGRLLDAKLVAYGDIISVGKADDVHSSMDLLAEDTR